MRRRTYVVILVVAFTVAQSFIRVEGRSITDASVVGPTAAGARVAGDWSQLQHDPQRTGYTAEEVRPPYAYLWKWNEVPFASRTQPVVAGGRLFIGALDGRMYARDARTGAPLWAFETGGPIRHSAAVYEERVLFGSHDGNIYALDADQGSVAWTYQTEGGVSTAPAVADDTVYIGSTDGIFYAVNTHDGTLRWSHDVGYPILTSAALSADGSTVYFGAENIAAYALDAATGGLRWSTPLQGQSLADRWPVVVGDTVIYRSQSLYDFHRLLHEGDDAMDRAGAVDSIWTADWDTVRPRILSYLNKRPDRQTFFALDADTGALRGTAPVLYTYGNGDAPAPPTVRGEEIYLLYRARHGIQQDAGSNHVTTRYDAALGEMNLSSLDIANLTSAPGESWHLQYRATSDEPAMLSMGGSMLFVDNWTRLGGIDVDTGALFEVANVVDYWPECNTNCVGRSGPMPYFESYPFPPRPRVGEGRVHRAAVIADGALYWRVLDGGLAAIANASDAQSEAYVWSESNGLEEQETDGQSPLARTAGERDLSEYVWDEPVRPVPHLDSQLAARLEEEIQAVVDAGRLAPFYLERGFTTPQSVPGDSAHPEEGQVGFGPGNVYWYDPGELVYSLSLAYPYLSPGLQHQVRAYLQTEMKRYPPLEPLPWPARESWLSDGARREHYVVTISPSVWPPPTPPLSTLYALWAYADATGDWDYLSSRWSQIDALFDSKKNEVDSYAAIAGAIGYARIAAHLGRSSAAQEGEAVAVAGMRAGQDFDAFKQTANERYPDPRGHTTGLRAPVFFGLVPEVGNYLRDTNLTAVTNYLNTLTDYYDGQYLWYLTRLGVQKEKGESSFHGPELAWSVFLTKAYVQEIQPGKLLDYLDRPWGLGDLYYVQKSVTAIEALGLPYLNSSTKSSSAIIPRSGETVTYTIAIRNGGAPITRTLHMTDTVPPDLSYVPGTLTATFGTPRDDDAPTLVWSGILSDTPSVLVTYVVSLPDELTQAKAIRNTATIGLEPVGELTRTATIIANGKAMYLPIVFKD